MSQSEAILREEEKDHALNAHIRQVSAWCSNTAGARPRAVHISVELADGSTFTKHLVHQHGESLFSDEYSL